MTEKYTYYVFQQAQRDQTLWTLALLALCLVAAWELLAFAPPHLARWLRPLYLAGGAVLYLAGLIIPYIATGGKP